MLIIKTSFRMQFILKMTEEYHNACFVKDGTVIVA